MKNIISIRIIMFFIVLLFGCENQLIKKPSSILTYQGYWESEEAARASIIGVHAALRDFHRTLWELGEIRSDIWGGKTMESHYDLDLVWQDISVNKVPFPNWAGFYSLIHKCNDAIENIPSISFTNNDEKNILLAQVHGIRSFVYFVLLKTWGDVPLVTEPTHEINFAELQKKRSSEIDIMDQVKEDIDISIQKFDGNNSFYDGRRTFWSLAASLMLKGEIYIWDGVHLNQGNNSFEEAKRALQNLIGMEDKFDLLPNYSDIFSYDNKENKEIIFALSFELNQAINFYSLFTARQTDIDHKYDSESVLIGNRFQLGFADYGNRYGLSDNIRSNLFSDSNDQRAEASIFRIFNKPGKSEYAGCILNKFLGTIDGGSRKPVDDIPVFRLAEAYLLLAEVKNHLIEDPSNEINIIRKRALGSNYNSEINGYSNQTKEENIETILNESLKEFIGEGKRWWSLRRAGDKYVIKHNDYLHDGDEYLLKLPITREMIGRNPELIQTPGYN